MQRFRQASLQIHLQMLELLIGREIITTINKSLKQRRPGKFEVAPSAFKWDYERQNKASTVKGL